MSDSPKLLLVDDDVSLRELLRSELEDRWDISEAGTLKQAKEVAEINHPDAILLDLNLPCSKGVPTWTTMQMLCPNIPVVIFAEYQEDAATLLNAGIKEKHIVIKGSTPLHEITKSILTAIKEVEVSYIYASGRAKLHDSDLAIQEMRALNAEVPKLDAWKSETKKYPNWKTPEPGDDEVRSS